MNFTRIPVDRRFLNGSEKPRRSCTLMPRPSMNASSPTLEAVNELLPGLLILRAGWCSRLTRQSSQEKSNGLSSQSSSCSLCFACTCSTTSKMLVITQNPYILSRHYKNIYSNHKSQITNINHFLLDITAILYHFDRVVVQQVYEQYKV